jgi:hypothetical protein
LATVAPADVVAQISESTMIAEVVARPEAARAYEVR